VVQSPDPSSRPHPAGDNLQQQPAKSPVENLSFTPEPWDILIDRTGCNVFKRNELGDGKVRNDTLAHFPKLETWLGPADRTVEAHARLFQYAPRLLRFVRLYLKAKERIGGNVMELPLADEANAILRELGVSL
jgi:hypothetical protein